MAVRGVAHLGEPWPERLSVALPARTRQLHWQAERTGFVADLIRGRGSRPGYLLYLRNLLPAYGALEHGLQGAGPKIRWFARPELARLPALEADLLALAGPEWAALPVLSEGRRYQARVAEAAAGDGTRLLAHAYVRYLGDLSGGRILRKVLARSLALPPEALRLYDFPGIPDVEPFKARFRAALDRAGRDVADVAQVLAEADAAFQLNIELSEAVQGALRQPARLPPAA